MVELLFENDDVVAARKPAGVPSIPGRGSAAAGALNGALERQLGRKLWVVHRLDLEASGLIVLAKNAPAHARLCAAFEGRGVRKTYLALAHGRVEAAGEVSLPLKEFGSGRTGVHAAGKPCLTRYVPRAQGKDCALLTVEPLTGRRHQIRAHLAALGHPILGDPLYGPPPRPVGGAPRLMLHALSLALPGLPALSCPPSPDFEAVCRERGVSPA